MRPHQRFTSAYCAGLLSILGACSLGGPLRTDQVAEGYHLAPLPVGWRKVEGPTGSDNVFQHSASGAQVLVKSVCGRYEDESLATLSQDLVNTVVGAEKVGERSEMIDGRESLWALVRGKLDGVEVEGTFVTLRKNRCIFDFSLLSKAPLSEKAASDFSRWVRSFRFSGGPK